MAIEPVRREHARGEAASCPAEARLESYLAQQLSDAEAAGIRTHVESCARCGAWMREAQADEAILGAVRGALRSPASPVPGGRGSSDFRSAGRTAGAAHDSALAREPVVRGYRIVGKLGEGGMGVVYEAEQEHPRRTVALKVVQAGRRLSTTHLRLFQREADALARLRHPAIAAIHEAGHTADGDPFFAMELVRGAALNVFAAREKPALRQRLALFRQIADAIHYAHQRGVIHRDLKPGNILVVDDVKTCKSENVKRGPDPEPSHLFTLLPFHTSAQPKILDFGLARILDEELAERGPATEPGRIQGSLPYMSPEQARGQSAEVDVRSDVYALGVILYELLTGELPYRVSRRALHEAVQMICEEPPRRPSLIDRTLRGDLEAIVLKALEKDPQRRYASAAALAEDIERHLNHHPVLARRPTFGYQLRKAVRRHRVGAAFGGILAATVLAFSIGMTALYFQARESRAEAERSASDARTNAATAQQESRKSQEISRFLEKTLAAANPSNSRGHDVTMREALTRASATLDRGELSGQPDVEAALRTTIGRALLALSAYPDARKQFERATELGRAHFGPRHESVSHSLDDLSQCLYVLGEIDEAERLAQESLAIRRELFADDHPAVLANRVHLAQLARERGAFDEAESQLRDALAGLRAHHRGDHRDVAATLHDLGSLLTRRGKPAEAEALLRDAIAMHRRLVGDEHPDVAASLQALGQALQVAGRWRDAEQTENEVLDLARRLYHEPHATTAISLNNSGTLAFARQDYAAAERYLREALEMDIALFGEKHLTTAYARNNLGDTLRELSRLDEAETQIRGALELRRELVGEQHPDFASSTNSLAILLRQRGKSAEAGALFRQAHEIRSATLGPGHKDTLSALSNLGGILKYRREYAAAEPVLREALAGERAALGDRHSQVALTLNHLGETLIGLQRPDDAQAALDEALAIRQAVFGPDHASVGDVLTLLARVASLRGDFAAGLPLLEQALEIRRKLGENHTAVGLAHNNLGFFYKELKRFDEAESHFRQALEIYRAAHGEQHPEIGTTMFNLAELAKAAGDADQAESWYEQSYEVLRTTRGPDDRLTLDVLKRLIASYEGTGKVEKAAELRAALPSSP